MEHTSIDSDVENYKFHSGAPDSISYNKACSELIEKNNALESGTRFKIFRKASLLVIKSHN